MYRWFKLTTKLSQRWLPTSKENMREQENPQRKTSIEKMD